MNNNANEIKQNHLNSNSRFTIEYFVFVCLWWISFIVYPLWYVPGSALEKGTVFAVLFLVFLVVSYSFRILTRYPYIEVPQAEPFHMEWRFFLPAFVLAGMLHSPFLGMPILTGLDTIDHAAVPAVVAASIVDNLNHTIGFDVQALLAALALLALASMCIKQIRLKIFCCSSKMGSWFQDHFWKTIAAFFIVSLIYFWAVTHTAFPDRFGDIRTIFRYPPLSKLILTPIYLVFGLNEYWSRLIQIGFQFGGAVYLYRLGNLLSGKTAGRVCALLFLFTPPLFHYSHTHMIDTGSLFFIAASFFYLITYIETKQPWGLVRGCLFMTMAFLYKHPGVCVVPAFFLMVAYDTFFPKRMQLRPALRPSFFACLIPALTILSYMKLADIDPDTPSELSILSLHRMAANLWAIPQGMTWLIALLFLAAFVYLAMKKEKRIFCLLLCWIITHFLISSISATYANVRQSLPYYVGLFVMASIFLDQILQRFTIIRAFLLYIVLPCYLIGHALFYPYPTDYQKIGRALGDRSYINFNNWNDTYVPYGEIVRDLIERTEADARIFAPMANEPIQFYLKKYDWGKREWIRELWSPKSEHTLAALKEQCITHNVDWLLLPRGRWLYSYMRTELIERMFESPPDWAKPVHVYKFGTTQVGLWKIEIN